MIETDRTIATPEQNSTFFHRLNSNTAYLDNYSWGIDNLIRYVPDKIKNRLKINSHGLNKMTTVIVSPGQQKNLNQEFLNSVINFSALVNESIGLPKTNSLVIRTAKANFFSPGGNISNQNLSEPMVLASHIGSGQQKLLLKSEKTPTQQIASLQELSNIFPYDKYLLIHDDNEKLQKEAVHGTFVITDNVSEIVIRKGSLHARNMTSKEFPHLKFTSGKPDYLFEIDPYTLSGLVKGEVVNVKSPRINIEGYTLTGSVAHFISKEAKIFSEEILEKYKKVTKLFGENTVMEFRLYPQIQTLPYSNRMQILDANIKFV
jgi:hypothetical protein